MSFGDKTVILTEIPCYSDISYFKAQIDFEELNRIIPSDYQAQLEKTRAFIWKNPGYLAAPFAGDVSIIHVVVPNDESFDALNAATRADKLSLSGPHNLSPHVYQQCITYSFYFRLAPTWNRIADIWINASNNLLTCAEAMPAVIWEPHVSVNVLASTLKAMRVRLPFISLGDHNVDMGRLRSTGRASMMGGQVFSLPHMKPCTAVFVCTTIPSDCPFKTYDLLRKHWKNSYGLRLPMEEKDMLYVQVSYPWSPELYTYPIICLRSCNVVRMICREPSSTITSFARDIKVRCDNVCGVPLAFYDLAGEPLFPPAPVEYKQEPHVLISPAQPAWSIPGTQPLSLTAPRTPDDWEKNSKRLRVIMPVARRLPKEKFVPIFKANKNSKVGQVNSFEVRSQDSFATVIVNAAAVGPDNRPAVSQSAFTPIFKPKPSNPKAGSAPKVIHLGSAVTISRISAKPKQDFSERVTSATPPCAPATSATPPCAPATSVDQDATSVRLTMGVGARRPPIAFVSAQEIEMAISRKRLHTVNVPSLRVFSKEYLIPVKSKDKKNEIVQKIYEFFGQTAPQ